MTGTVALMKLEGVGSCVLSFFGPQVQLEEKPHAVKRMSFHPPIFIENFNPLFLLLIFGHLLNEGAGKKAVQTIGSRADLDAAELSAVCNLPYFFC